METDPEKRRENFKETVKQIDYVLSHSSKQLNRQFLKLMLKQKEEALSLINLNP